MGRTNGKLRPEEMSFEVAAGDSEGLLRDFGGAGSRNIERWRQVP